MPLYDQRDANATFTGFGLDERKNLDEDFDSPESDEDERTELQQLASSHGMTRDQLEGRWAGFSNQQSVVRVCNVLVAVGFFFWVHAALKALSVHLADADGPALFRIMYQPVIWWFLPGFGAMCLAWEITIQIWSLFAGRKTIRLYRAWVKQAPFTYKGSTFHNQLAFYHWFSALVVLPIAVFTLLALNMHTNIGESHMRVCGYAFKPCKDLSFSDLRRDDYFPAYGKGKSRLAAKVVLKFADGTDWNSNTWTDSDVDPDVARFLLSKAPDGNTSEQPK
jgi:hypothetical protein